MLREWRFIARSAASPTPSAGGDPAGAFAEAADALVDRRAIDWRAARSRAATARDRAALDALHLVERLRESALRGPAPFPSRAAHPLAAAIAILAALQIAACVGILAAAWADGVAIERRLVRMAVALSFAASSVLLWPAARVDGSSGYLRVAFAAAASAFARASTATVGASYVAPASPLLRGLYPEAFIPACLWWFALNFPRVRRFTAFDRVGRRFAAIASWLGMALFIVNLLGAYAVPLPPAIDLLLRNHPANGFWTVFALLAAPAVFATFFRARWAPCSERRRTHRFAAALAVGVGPLLITGLVRALFPSFDRWILAAGTSRSWFDLLVIVPLLATPVLTAFAMQQHPFGTPVLFTSVRRRLAASAAGAAGLLLRALERRLAGRTAEVGADLLRALDRIRGARASREVIDVVVHELRRATGARRVHVLVASPGGFGGSHGVDQLDAHSALAAMLHHTSPIDVSAAGRLFPLMPPADRQWLAANAIEMVAAVTHRDGELAAVIALGPRRRAAPYAEAERWLIVTIAAAAGAVWDQGSGRTVDEALDDAALECPRCGAVAASVETLCTCGDPRAAALPHRLAGKFVVLQRLGAGSMGVVYRARDVALDRDVAIKTLPEVSGPAVARLREEARVMAVLAGEGLATIYGVEMWRRTPALIMEYLPSGTLADRLRSAPLREDDAVRLGISLANALEQMHARGLLHRDLKPSNIGLTAAGTPKLLDFGLATFRTIAPGAGEGGLDGRRTNERVAGTFAYLPPEALTGAPPAPSLDLWALALVLREALTGSRSTPAPQLLASMSPAWEPFFERALAENPVHRFADAAAFREALEAPAFSRPRATTHL